MAVDLNAAQLALRNRALGLVVATTGVLSLSATTTGYARTLTGAPGESTFLTDGFLPGMEVTPAGFAANTVDVITGVTANTLTVATARAAEADAGGRSLTVGPPALRGYEGKPITPVTGRPYWEEEFVDATSSQKLFPVDGSQMEETGLYVIKWYGLVSVGAIPGLGSTALRRQVDALKARFAAGTIIGPVEIRPDIGPTTGQVIPLTGWSCLILTASWRARSRNVVLA